MFRARPESGHRVARELRVVVEHHELAVAKVLEVVLSVPEEDGRLVVLAVVDARLDDAAVEVDGREVGEAAGEASMYYTTHGLRAGGATDLVSRGITYPMLKSVGRWQSDACLVYFRSEEAVSSMDDGDSARRVVLRAA